jgi:hypothetical protein
VFSGLDRLFQIPKSNKVLPRTLGKVIVLKRPDVSLGIPWKGKRLLAVELPIPKKANQTLMPPEREEDISIVA